MKQDDYNRRFKTKRNRQAKRTPRQCAQETLSEMTYYERQKVNRGLVIKRT